MRPFLISLYFLLLLTANEATANRSLYVDDFASILGDTAEENTLLRYAQDNGIETLLLYELHLIHNAYDLTNPASNTILANFISKAKGSYGILNMAATAENPDAFTNVIDVYNTSRTDPNEKFDTYNLEFEFWNGPLTDPGGYYCTSYLVPNGLPCTNNGAFQYFVSTLQSMNALATNSSHPITVEAYVGWPTASQADTIAANLDRLLLHAYVTNPANAFNYAEDRLMDFANSRPDMEVSIIYSSEPVFMQNWLENNSMSYAESIFVDQWVTTSANWPNNVSLDGFTYFSYESNINIEVALEHHALSDKVNVYPNPVHQMLTIEHTNTLESIKVYDSVGQLVLVTKEQTIDLSAFPNGMYIVHIQSATGVVARRIVKG